MLRLSTRSIERLVRAGKIQSSRRARPNRRPLVVVNLSDVETPTSSPRYHPAPASSLSDLVEVGPYGSERISLMEQTIGRWYIDRLTRGCIKAGKPE
jgi:hypothetical protein